MDWKSACAVALLTMTLVAGCGGDNNEAGGGRTPSGSANAAEKNINDSATSFLDQAFSSDSASGNSTGKSMDIVAMQGVMARVLQASSLYASAPQDSEVAKDITIDDEDASCTKRDAQHEVCEGSIAGQKGGSVFSRATITTEINTATRQKGTGSFEFTFKDFEEDLEQACVDAYHVNGTMACNLAIDLIHQSNVLTQSVQATCKTDGESLTFVVGDGSHTVGFNVSVDNYVEIPLSENAQGVKQTLNITGDMSVDGKAVRFEDLDNERIAECK
ncbi:MAG: hypothetical protein HY540_02030 [Deltaproteobacteria bacterium]|nr:hypothetical protein [Deltaproteobacteria bacterium]